MPQEGVCCIVMWLMQTKVIKLDTSKIDTGKIREAADLVDAGGLAAFPTETVYGIACRARKDSLNKLDDIKRREHNKRYALHIGEKNDVSKYIPRIGLKAEKLIKKAWPGPLTIVFELEEKDIDKQRKQLDREVFESLYKDNSIGIRCPDNPIASALLRAASNPVVAPSANITGQSPAVDAEQVLGQLSGQVELLLDGGSCKYKTSSTVVKIGKEGLEILREGVYQQAEVEAFSQINFLFVCTGNTCRSPMGEGMFRKYLAEKLRCGVDKLDKMGYKVNSAGTMDMAGFPASPGAVGACEAKGIDISAHRSSNITRRLIEESDYIFAMQQFHCDRIVEISSDAAGKCELLAENKDIADPIGQSQGFYNNCAELIEKAVIKRISEFVI